MNPFRMLSVFIARVFLSSVFLLSGLSRLMKWHEAEESVVSAFCDWQAMSGFSQTMQEIFAFLISWAPLLLLFGTLFEILGALMLFFGWKERMSSLFLLIFLILTTFLFHPFWMFEGVAYEMQSALFLKNLAISGGLILVSLHGLQIKAGGGIERY